MFTDIPDFDSTLRRRESLLVENFKVLTDVIVPLMVVHHVIVIVYSHYGHLIIALAQRMRQITNP